MKHLLIVLFVLFISNQITFGQKKTSVIFTPPILGISNPEYSNACELPNHKNELVYTRFVYSGMEEYWRLSPVEKCTDINADLEIPDSVYINRQNLKLLKYVHEHYWNCYLIIDAIGYFDNSNKKGYGHLGTNTSQFTIQKIINIQKAIKKRQ